MQCGKGRTGPHSPRGVPAGYIASRLLRQAAGKGTPHPSSFSLLPLAYGQRYRQVQNLRDMSLSFGMGHIP